MLRRVVSGLLALAAMATMAPSASFAEGEAPAREPHPLPRVVVDVVSAKGPLEAGVIQANARAKLWGKAVGCYKVGARIEQTLEIDRTFGVEIASGKVKVPGGKKATRRKAKTKVDRAREAPAKSPEAEVRPVQLVERCLADAIASVEMPRARRSTAKIRVRIWPGDVPVE